MVSPILLYGAEVWGLNEIQDPDKIHIKFCKTILGVRKQTPNAVILGELGRYPLSLIAKERALKYWVTLLSRCDSLSYKLYTDQCGDIAFDHRCNLWANMVFQTVNRLGLGDMWTNQDLQLPNFSLIKQRCRDQYGYTPLCQLL